MCVRKCAEMFPNNFYKNRVNLKIVIFLSHNVPYFIYKKN